MKVKIFYFSATGNTAVAAQGIATNLQKQGHEVALEEIEKCLASGTAVNLAGYDLLGIGHPVYGLGAPRIMREFIAELPAGHSLATFVFKTAGDIHWINNAASVQLIRQLSKKGFSVFHDSLMAMPANWLVRYDNRLSRQLYIGTLRRCQKIAGEVAAGEKSSLRAGLGLRWFACLANYGEDAWGARFFGRNLYPTAECTSCGQCARLCPHGNISLTKDKPSFGWNCMMCMRCIYKCPHQAIAARFLKRVILKDYRGGAELAVMADDPALQEPYLVPGGKTKYQHMLDYVKE